MMPFITSQSDYSVKEIELIGYYIFFTAHYSYCTMREANQLLFNHATLFTALQRHGQT